MNLNEAYAKLDLTSAASEDDVKKRFRELSKKWHPDKNQNNPDAEAKFKEINSAYQRITNPNERERYQDIPTDNPFQGFDFGGMGNPFANPFQQQRRRQAPPVKVNLTISFKESILGCKKDIKYNRNIKCNTCNGQGSIKINTDCKKCGGTGSVVQRSANMMFVKQCECSANQKIKKCSGCNDGVISSESSVNVQVPGGVSDENALRLESMGNYAGSMGHFDQYSDAFVILNVTADPDLTLEDDKVVFNLNISLLEALKGVKKNIKTVVGDKEIIINPLSKNKEEVIIPHVGVNGKGDQRVILNVQYPDDIDSLIKSLE
jgi:molecular chaperone DnaJ